MGPKRFDPPRGGDPDAEGGTPTHPGTVLGGSATFAPPPRPHPTHPRLGRRERRGRRDPPNPVLSCCLGRRAMGREGIKGLGEKGVYMGKKKGDEDKKPLRTPLGLEHGAAAVRGCCALRPWARFKNTHFYIFYLKNKNTRREKKKRKKNEEKFFLFKKKKRNLFVQFGLVQMGAFLQALPGHPRRYGK